MKENTMKITTMQQRVNLAAVSAQTRMTALANEPELGGARNTDEGFHIGIGAAAAGVIGVAVAAFITTKMGLLH
jgi:hypothetical protein